MKNVQGLVSCVVVLGLLAGCGRQTATTYWNGTAWVSSSTSVSSAATASPTQIYALSGNGNMDLFKITLSSGHLILATTPATLTFTGVQSITAGVWTYKVNSLTGELDLYSTSDLTTIVESFSVAGGFTAISQ